MDKKTIAVLFGGSSSEYSVSLSSAASVLTHLDREKYEVIPVGITERGAWFRYYGEISEIENDGWHKDPVNLASILPSPEHAVHGFLEFARGAQAEAPESAAVKNDAIAGTAQAGVPRVTKIDAVFPVLHGKNGEDGTVQGLFELAAIPIIGCGTLSSAVCMHKGTAHDLVEHAGIDVPQALVAHKSVGAEGVCALVKNLTLPLFVKPVRSGSSIGVTKAHSQAELLDAVKLAFDYDDEVIIEEYIRGVEIGCAVMGTDILTVGRPDEIEMQGELFDFTEKYTLVHSQIHMPARIDSATEQRVLETAKRIYRILGCRVFARVDQFLTEDGRVVFNEVNTIPGFTHHSRFPNMMKGIGLSFEEMLDSIIAIGLQS